MSSTVAELMRTFSVQERRRSDHWTLYAVVAGPQRAHFVIGADYTSSRRSAEFRRQLAKVVERIRGGRL